MYLSVVIPVYNEEKNIKKTVFEFEDYLSKNFSDYEIVIVNDGSRDKTESLCLDLQAKNKKIKFLNNKVNRGKGFAVREGMKNSEGKYILFIDADNATSIDHLERARVFLQNDYDVIIGSRNSNDVNGAYQNIKQALWKRLLGMAGNYFIRKIVGEKIRDTQCGFKIFKKDLVEKILPKMLIDRWGFDVEFMVLARLNNAKIGIIPVVWNNSDKSRVGIRGYFTSLGDILRIRLNLFKGRYE